VNARGAPAVFTIPSHQAYVDILAAGILERIGHDPEALAKVRVLLPTRRACRSLREAFLRLSGGTPTLLPRMTPLGDVDEDELVIGGEYNSEEVLSGDGGFDIPPAMSGTRRQLTLARLIMARGDTSADQAVRLAVELARLLDQIHTERRPFKDLKNLVPDEFAEHWQQTLKFLTILTELWPAVLEEAGVIDAADRRNRLLEAQAHQWREQPPDTMVIAAGSTGSIPATADLLSVISRMPNGAVVLPGLDQISSDDAWKALEAHHPQYGLARLLEHLDTPRSAVKQWHDTISTVASGREKLIARALIPASATLASSGINFDTTDSADDAGDLARLSVIDCPTPREEAGVIAIAMRQVLEQPGKTVALVSPDRGLARRVAVNLRRWQIDVDDSAGQPLALTPAGSLLRLSARMCMERFAPVSLLAALKHPLVAGGMDRPGFRRLVRRLELTTLRGPRPGPDVCGLRSACGSNVSELEPLLDNLDAMTKTFIELIDRREVDISELISAHVSMVEHLASTDQDVGAEYVWGGEDGEALASFIAELADAASALGPINPDTYPALLDNLMAARSLRPRFGRHPRVFIWGLMEARLQRADLMILGGLNEASWPPDAPSNPWMSRPMMASLGLALPERRIGLTAHDFAQGFTAPNVLLTRSERVDGTPTVPSRWLLRLDNCLKALGRVSGLPRRSDMLGWFEALDQPDASTPGTVTAPAPTPPIEARPNRLSVTRIETWIRDPYAIYAERILRLKPLDPLDADPGAADRGNVIHDALEKFISAMPAGDLPDDAADQLIEIGRGVFNDLLVRPGIRAFWWPRFLRIAEWFVEMERARRAGGVSTLANEVVGEMDLLAAGMSFTLTAKADRIDRLPDGSLAILDYKTGQPPSQKQVETGLTPQLTLEAIMASEGAFNSVPAGSVGELSYIQLSGGRVPGRMRQLKFDIEEMSSQTLTGLRRLITAFQNPNTPYRSRPRPQFKSRFGTYDHLARVREWANAEGDDGP
jgi:ATP-dependent helicase/nuclease subunit B